MLVVLVYDVHVGVDIATVDVGMGIGVGVSVGVNVGVDVVVRAVDTRQIDRLDLSIVFEIPGAIRSDLLPSRKRRPRELKIKTFSEGIVNLHIIDKSHYNEMKTFSEKKTYEHCRRPGGITK